MDLAESIRANTAAVQALTGLLTSLHVQIKGTTLAGFFEPGGAPEPRKGDNAPSAAITAAPEPDAPKPVDPALVKATATKLAAQSRDALVKILAKYGAKKFTEVKAEDLAAFHADVQAAL